VVVDVSVLGPGDRARFSMTIGAVARDGSVQQGAHLGLILDQSHKSYPPGYYGTLDRMVDGEEWLAVSLSRVVAAGSPLARVVIGPTDRVPLYEEGSTLKEAIDLLAEILSYKGIVVVIYGSGASVRTDAVSEHWTVLPVAGHRIDGSVRVQRSGPAKGPMEFHAFVA